jgi:hypothetical protein
MARVRRKPIKNQSRIATALQQAIPLDDGTVTTPAALAMIRALIPLGLQAVEAALVTEVEALAGPRYTRGDARPEVVRWGAQRGSNFLADQHLPISVPRVRDRAAPCEVPLATYLAMQKVLATSCTSCQAATSGSTYRMVTPCFSSSSKDVGVLRIVLIPGGERRLAVPGAGERRDEHHIEPRRDELKRQGTMVYARRLEAQTHWLRELTKELQESLHVVPAIGEPELPPATEDPTSTTCASLAISIATHDAGDASSAVG